MLNIEEIYWGKFEASEYFCPLSVDNFLIRGICGLFNNNTEMQSESRKNAK